MIAIQTSAAGWAPSDEQRADELTFVYKSLVDDFAVISRIQPPASGPAATGGLSVRAGLGSSDAAVSLAVSPAGELLLHNRSVAGGTNETWLVGAAAYGSWLKLERRGTAITAFHSLDGTQWTSVGQGTIPETRTVAAGMGAASGNPDAMLQVLVTDFRTEPLSTLPAGWNAVQVGVPAGSNGAASYRDGVFTIFNSSASLGDFQDSFGFVSLRVTGDAEIVARVLAPGTTGGSEAGVMARASLDPDAAYVFAGVDAPGTLVTKRRIGAGLSTAAGLSASLFATDTALAGWWLKLVRRGPLLTTFGSQDGSGWTSLASDVLPLPDTILLGLAFASGSGLTAQGVFDQVSVRALAANQPPLVAVTAPDATAAVAAGDAVVLSASASDPDDRVDAVEFYVDGVLIGADTAAPYQATWAEAREGTHVVTAVAIDSESARTTSAPVTVSVFATVPATPPGSSTSPTTPVPALPPVSTSSDPIPTGATAPGDTTATPPISTPEETPPLVPSIPPPASAPATSWRLQFAPSPDHDQTVDRYVLQVLPNDLNSVGVELDLGHPIVSNGLCTVDVSATVAALAAGSYVFSVRAFDADAGLFSSATTTNFTR